MLRKAFALSAAAIIALLFFAAPSQARTIDEIIKSGTIKIGVTIDLPPMSSYNNKNELEGFDVDIATRIAQMLGVKLELVPQELSQRIPNIISERTDLTLGDLTRTPDRAKVVDFSVPLHTESMAVLTTDKVQAEKWQDLNREDVTLVTVRGSFAVSFWDANLPKAKRLLVDSAADVVRSIAQGRASATVENINNFMPHTKQYTDVKWKVLPQVISYSFVGIAMKKGNYGLRDWLNVALLSMHGAGGNPSFVNQTWEKWWGAPMLTPLAVQPFF